MIAARSGAPRLRIAPVVLASLLALGIGMPAARAQHMGLRSFGEAEGLESDAVSVMAQAPAGFLVVCTESGVFFFNGRTFHHIGPDQGVPALMDVRTIAVATDSRIAIADDQRVLVSGRTTGTLQSALRFADATPGDIPSTGAYGHMAWWGGRLIVERGGRLLPAMAGHPAAPAALWSLRGASGIVAARDTLVVGTTDGRICDASAAALTCRMVGSTAHPALLAPPAGGPSAPTPAEHLSSTQAAPDDWTSLVTGADGTVYARSSSHFAYRPPHARDFIVEPLADDRTHDGYHNLPSLAALPEGTVVTEAQGHLIARRGGVWKGVTLPAGYGNAIPAALTAGRDGELWLGLPGAGVIGMPNFGNIMNYGASDGFDLRDIWQIGDGPHDTLLIGSTRGLLAIPDHGNGLPRLLPGGGVTMLQTMADGTVWAVRGVRHLIRYSSLEAPPVPVQTPPIRQLLPDGPNAIWILSDGGLYHASTATPPSTPPTPDPSFRFALRTGLVDRRRRLWLATRDALLLRTPDGHAETILARWPEPGFRPNSIASGGPDTVMVGGAGRLLSINRQAPGRIRIVAFREPAILSRTIYSLATSPQGTIWAATDHGVAAFDGRQWLDITTHDGLIWNDINQYALFPGADGSVWVGTSIGFSHILDPSRLFHAHPLHVAVADIQVGNAGYDGRRLPFSYAPLTIRFAVDNPVRSAALHFRYRLDGVDHAWNETPNASVQYPSLPPGQHVFRVIALDPMTGVQSPPTAIEIDMTLPWWDWWPVKFAYGLAAVMGILGIVHLRDRLQKRQRRVLMQTVALRTRELEAAKTALEHEARTDGMTGLLNRRAIQQLLSDILESPRFANGRGHHPAANAEQGAPYVVALLDIDHFKQINDRFGHLVGDQVLRETGDRLRLLMKPHEYCGRYGGEEFLFVAKPGARPGIERVAELIDALTHAPFVGSVEIPVTLSVGFATTTASDTWQSVIGRADKALYGAKVQGRDRIVTAA